MARLFDKAYPVFGRGSRRHGRKRDRQMIKISELATEGLPHGYAVVRKRTTGGCPYVRIWEPGAEFFVDICAGPEGSFIISNSSGSSLRKWMDRKGYGILPDCWSNKQETA